MPLIDLLHSLPGLVLVAFLPGLLLSTACAPRWHWWLRAALAPGLSGGVAGVAGMVYHDAHVRFSALTALPVLAVLVAGAWWRAGWGSGGRRRPAPGEEAAAVGVGGLSPRVTAVMVAAALIAGAATVAVMAASLHDQPLPFNTDTPVHGQIAAAIARTGEALPALPEPVTGSTWARTRTGFEAVAALVSEVGGPAPALAMLPVAAVSVLLLPLGIAALAWEATRSRRIAMLTPLLGIALPFPTFPVIFGELPLVMDSTLVTGLVLAAVYAVRGERVRDCAAMIVALVASVWVIHGTEVLTALVVGGPLLMAMLWSLRSERGARLRAAASALAVLAVGCLAGAALVTVVTRPPVLLAAGSNPLGGPGVAGTARFAGSIAQRRWIDLEYLFRYFVFPAQWVILLWLLGIAAALVGRRLRWALVAQVVMIGCLADVVVTGRLTKLWQAVFPWSTDDRLMSIQYWVLPMLMALGVVFVVDAVGAGLRRRGVAVGAAALAAVAAVVAWPGLSRMGDLYTAEKAAHAAATQSDFAVLSRLGELLPPGSVVLTEGADDAGQWVGALMPDRWFFSTEYVRSHTEDERIVALSHACDDPQRAASVLAGIDAVFVGADRVEGARHPWSDGCMRRVPGLRSVSRDGASEAFVVIRH